MKVEAKTLKELIRQGLVSEQEVKDLPQNWIDTVALIFRNEEEASIFVRDVLLPKWGRERLLSVWSCLTGPADRNALAKAMNISPDDGQKWLLFKSKDFQTLIKPFL